MEPEVTFNVVFNKQPVAVENWDVTTRTLGDLKEHLEQVLGIPRANQKITAKGGILKEESKTLKELGIGNGSRVLLIGSSSAEVKQVIEEDTKRQQQAVLKPTAAPRVTPYDSTRRGIQTIQTIGSGSSDVRFGTIKVLDGWPNADRARSILDRLARDPGIVGVMKQHNWRVGTLSELSPLEVTILGLNQNRGQEIKLRLRFQEGFRSYASIKEVLYHELAHNEIDDHNSEFHALTRRIKKEAEGYDHTRGGRRLVEGRDFYQPPEEEELEEPISEDAIDHGGVGYRLGGGEQVPQHQQLSAKEMAARAALQRQQQQQQSNSSSPSTQQQQPQR